MVAHGFLRHIKEWLIDIPRFLFVQRIQGFSPPSEPHFDSDNTRAWFIEQLKAADTYVEYGAGGSTYLAAQLGKPFVSIDSDNYFLNAVRRKIEKAGLFEATRQQFMYATIGFTKAWGYPVEILKPSLKRLAAYAAYSDFPQSGVPAPNQSVLVLVDGRFRVACAAKAFLALKDYPHWQVVVDDYAGRPEYHVLEDVGMVSARIGRMVVFNGLKPQAAEGLPTLIERYRCDPR